MLTSSLIVVLLKHLAARHCPWDLVEYGGPLTEMNQWFTVPWLASHCFPSGHAAGGFSLVAVYFAGRRLGQTALARGGLIAGLTFGVVFSAVRVAQGAHFLSHNLWSAAVVWLTTSLIFMRPASEIVPGDSCLCNSP